ncbi:MAG: hypothetical protein EOO47_17040 [Flavobacterium sp.]|nr:MAG: hypothetical protein EOO47_17040 [Flavobacterium sp.]
MSKDPAHNDSGRRKAFYPYAAGPTIEIQVALQHSGVANLTPTDINLKFGPAVIFEEIETQIYTLLKHAKQNDDRQVVMAMKALVKEYKSKNSVFEELDELTKD